MIKQTILINSFFNFSFSDSKLNYENRIHSIFRFSSIRKSKNKSMRSCLKPWFPFNVQSASNKRQPPGSSPTASATFTTKHLHRIPFNLSTVTFIVWPSMQTSHAVARCSSWLYLTKLFQHTRLRQTTQNWQQHPVEATNANPSISPWGNLQLRLHLQCLVFVFFCLSTQ